MKTPQNLEKWIFPELPDRTFVSLEDYEWLHDYCDRLVDLGKLPCLPKDLENLRDANGKLAQENFGLHQRLDYYEKVMREYANAAAIFQPDGKYCQEANLQLGSSAVVEGIKWLDMSLEGYKAKLTIALADVHSLSQQLKEKKRSANEEYIFLLENKVASLQNDNESLKRDCEIHQSQARFLGERMDFLKSQHEHKIKELQTREKNNNAHWKNKCETAENKLDQIRNIL